MRSKSFPFIAIVSIVLLLLYARACQLNKADSKLIAHRFNDYQAILSDFASVYYSCCHTANGPSYLPNTVVQNAVGKEVYSWRFANFLNEPVPYQDLRGITWTSPNATRVRNTTPIPYNPVDSGNGSTNTSVFAVAVPGSAFDKSTLVKVSEIPSDLVLFADVFESNTHWMQPGDFDSLSFPNNLRVARGLGHKSYSGFFLAFADGEIWFMNDKTPIIDVKKFFTVAGARANHREAVLGKYALMKQHSDVYKRFVPIHR